MRNGGSSGAALSLPCQHSLMEVWGSRAKGLRSCAHFTARIHFVSPRGGQTCHQVELGRVHHWAQQSDQSTPGALEEELPKNGSDHSEVTAVRSALWRLCTVPGRPLKLELSVLTVPPKPEWNQPWQICSSGSSAGPFIVSWVTNVGAT